MCLFSLKGFSSQQPSTRRNTSELHRDALSAKTENPVHTVYIAHKWGFRSVAQWIKQTFTEQ